MHGNGHHYTNNEVVGMILNKMKKMGMMSEENFVCLNCVKVKFVQGVKAH